MRANCWMGRNTVEVNEVPDPKILNARDAIVRVTSTAICGSDLHLYNGFIPTMEKGDILGHEFMGEVVEVGRGVKNLKVGDRVVVPFPIACGSCCAVPARAVLAVRELQPERLDGREAVGPLARGHLRLLAPDSAASPAARPSTRACRSPTSARSRSRTACPTSRCCSCPTSSRPATWAPRCATSSRGDVDRRLGLRPGRAVRDRQRRACSAPSG